MKELVSKLGASSLRNLYLKKFMSLESTIKAQMTLLQNFINLMPTDAPPIHTGVQGGKGVSVGMGSKAGMGGSGSSKDGDDAKVFGKVMSTQIPTSMPKTSVPIISTMTTTRPLTKGIVIRRSSSSKPLQSNEAAKGKGKGISIEPTAKENKVSIEKEIEKQRHI